MEYRPEIDGMRAIAVLAVMGYHARLPFFSAGYLGVDVFFVISGYLITSILRRETERGTFTLAGFYERRVRRILPALFLVCLASVPAALLLMAPARMESFADALVAILTFSSNFFFYFESGYFAPATEESPLIHSWSLAVEEQFYLLYPLFFLALRRSRVPAVWLGAAWGLSFVAATILSEVDANASFYLLPTRAWELGAGALIAFLPESRGSRLLTLLGLAAILTSIPVIGERPPGPWTLPTVLGTALVVVYARGAAATFLSARPLVAIGLASYSAYLWHQPVFVFTRLYALGGDPRVALSLAAGLTAVLSWLSWRYVERPFRQRDGLSLRPTLIALGAGAVAIAGFALASAHTDGFAKRFDADEQWLLAYVDYETGSAYSDGHCNLRPHEGITNHAPECLDGEGPLLLGDSHAAALSHGLRENLPLRQLTAWGCPPLLDFQSRRMDIPHCAAIQSRMRQVLEAQPTGLLILHADWQRYLSESEEDVVAALEQTIRLARPGWSVWVVGGVPHWHPSLPERIVSTRSAGMGSVPTSLEHLRRADAKIAASANEAGAGFISLLERWCRATSCRAELRDGTLTTWDHSHLTAEGSEWVYRTMLAPVLGAVE